MTIKTVEDFKRYVNRAGFFQGGRYLVEYDGRIYDVEKVMKTLYVFLGNGTEI